MAGVFECVAENGVGPLAVGRISLQVQCKFRSGNQDIKMRGCIYLVQDRIVCYLLTIMG